MMQSDGEDGSWTHLCHAFSCKGSHTLLCEHLPAQSVIILLEVVFIFGMIISRKYEPALLS